MFSRRKVLALGAALSVPSASKVMGARARSGCIFGAIRWDAQYCDTPGQPCFEEEKALGPSKWRFRAPLHSQILGPEQIRFLPTQETFDQEIIAAKSNNLKYWAYLMYGEDGAIDLKHSMMKGLAFHRASSIKSQINYAMMLTVDTMGRTGNYSQPVKNIVSLLHDDNYQTALGKRPVIYLYYIEALLGTYWGGSLANMAEAINALRDAARNEGLGNPYIVLMDSPPASAEKVRAGLGADAISVYAIAPAPNISGPYSQLARSVRSYWEDEIKATSAGVVPTVMIGWDTRPRKEHPPAYDHRDRSHVDVAAHITAPTPAEFAAECQAAADFIYKHTDQCDSRLALIYAWNEDSEGGPLEPTLGDPRASKLAAAKNIMR
jgi:hypothetical protein